MLAAKQPCSERLSMPSRAKNSSGKSTMVEYLYVAVFSMHYVVAGAVQSLKGNAAVNFVGLITQRSRVQKNGDEISPHGPRYKNGTSSQAFFAFPSLPRRALQCDRCLVITTFSSLFAPFDGGNTGSNFVGDTEENRIAALLTRGGFRGLSAMGSGTLRGR
jgi:hypothetical protein